MGEVDALIAAMAANPFLAAFVAYMIMMTLMGRERR